MKPPNEATDLLHWPWVIMRFRCHYCRRWAEPKLAELAWDYGIYATVAQMLVEFRRPCPWRHDNPERRPQKYGHRCGAFCPDIGRASPPDWPPPMMGLTLIEGGKDDQLPAERTNEPARRRVGDTD